MVAGDVGGVMYCAEILGLLLMSTPNIDNVVRMCLFVYFILYMLFVKFLNDEVSCGRFTGEGLCFLVWIFYGR